MASRDSATLGWSIGVLFRAWQQSVSDALADFPHAARGHAILSFVARGDLPTQAAIAGHLGIDRTVLTYVLDDLVAAGVIERRADAADRRVRRLAVTPSGLVRLAELDDRVEAAELDVLAGVPTERRSALRAALAEVAVSIHRGEPGHDACAIVVDALSAGDTARSAAQ